MTPLAGRTALVIGVGGVGGGIARQLAGAGMRLAVADIDAVAAEMAASTITGAGGTAMAGQVDATDRAALRDLAARTATELGGPHVLVTTAAAITDRRLDACSEDDWAWIIESNLMTVVRAVDEVLPFLRAGGGPAHVVVTTSMAGVVATPAASLRGGLRNGLYTTTKHALVGYADMLRHELAEEGIGVSLLCPGVVQGNLRSTSARLRPARFGGPEPDPQIGMEPKRDPMSADAVGRLVVRAVEADQFWVFTHPDSAALLEDRAAEQRAGFAFLAASADGAS